MPEKSETSVEVVCPDVVRILLGLDCGLWVGGSGVIKVVGRRYMPMLDGCRAISSKASTLNVRSHDRVHRANCSLVGRCRVMPILCESVESIADPHKCNHTEGSPSLLGASGMLDVILECTASRSCTPREESCPNGHAYLKATFGILLESADESGCSLNWSLANSESFSECLSGMSRLNKIKL